MKISEGLIIRHVKNFSHILNPYTGNIVTLKHEDYLKLSQAHKKQVEKEIINTLKIPPNKYPNSRLFRHKLLELGRTYHFPTIVNIEITRRCLLDCIHCYITSEEHLCKKVKGIEALNARDVDHLVHTLRDMGVFLIVLTGGEPLIARNIKSFINSCQKYNITFEIFSSLQTIPHWLTRDLSKLSRIQTSVYSLQNETHDKITRKRGSLKNTLNNIQVLKDRAFYLEVATPLMNLNFDDREKTKKFFQNMNIPQNFSWPILNEYYTKKTSKASLNISKEQFAEFCQESPEYIIDSTWPDKKENLCEAGVSLFAISANGDIFPCSQYPLAVGNIFEENIQKIYNGIRMKKAINYKPNDLYNFSGFKKYHNFCIGNNYSETGNPLKQPTFMAESLKYAKLQLKKGGYKKYENKSS